MKVFFGILLSSSLSSTYSWQPNSVSRSAVRVGGVEASRPLPKPLRSSPLFYAASSDPPAPPSTDVTVSDSEDTTEEWTKQRLHNTATFRSAAILGALALAFTKSPVKLLSAQASASVHVLSFGTWFGTVAYTTFVAGITMFKNLPRKTFGKLQAKLFPKYFFLSSATLILQLVTIPSLSVGAKKSTTVLGVALAMTLLNQFYLEPLSTDNMMERYRLEDTPGGKDTDEYKKHKASFGKLHGMSSLTNLIALCAGVVHAVYIASALVGGGGV
jgi:hypothetical protein